MSAALPLPTPETLLILDSTKTEQLTARREGDVVTAMTRGLAEYVGQLVLESEDGREVRFHSVVHEHAEPEEDADYPVAVVATEGAVSYDASNFTPKLSGGQIPTPDGRFVTVLSEAVATLVLHIFATDREMRSELAALLELGLSPTSFMYGCRLELPHYHNSRATYEPVSITYVEADGKARAGIWEAVIRLNATSPVIRLDTIPLSEISLRLTVEANC